VKGKQKESAGWSSGSYSVKSTVEELAEVVRKAEGRKRGRSGSRKGSPLTAAVCQQSHKLESLTGSPKD